jgi:hypothetical protein
VVHFRVTSVDALGARAVSADAVFVTPRRGARGAAEDVTVRRITSTTAVVSWTASTSIAQVEYGPTPAYGSFTLLQVFNTVNQDMVVSGLRPETLYHFRVKTWDGAGITTTSTDFTFNTASPRHSTLLGNSAIDERRTTIPPGQAYAFQYSAASSGLGAIIRLYVDAATSAPSIGLGLYADDAGVPGALLAQSTIERPTLGAWNSAPLPGVSLSQGSTYWIAVLNPAGSGTLAVRGATGVGTSMPTVQNNLRSLPLSWLAGPSGGTTTLSAYVLQTIPAVTLIEPSDGRVVSGLVTVAATVDDEAPIRSVQFMVDGAAVGGPALAAPYTAIWDSRRSTTHEFHTVSAKVTDAVGRVAYAPAVWVHVDNGAAISQVQVGAVSSSTAWISWSTDSYSDSQVEFGLTDAYGQTAPLDASYTWLHRQQLVDLRPGTTYHYRVKSRDARGVVGVSRDFTFTTRPAAP